MIKKCILLITAIWLGQSALIDLAIVPTVFRTVNDFFNAGELGIALFSKFNNLELVWASCLVGFSALQLAQTKKGKTQFLGFIITLAITLTYVVFLTPKIMDLTHLWKTAEINGQISINGIPDIQQEHQYYHKAYVYLDSIKMLILAGILCVRLVKDRNTT